MSFLHHCLSTCLPDCLSRIVHDFALPLIHIETKVCFCERFFEVCTSGIREISSIPVCHKTTRICRSKDGFRWSNDGFVPFSLQSPLPHSRESVDWALLITYCRVTIINLRTNHPRT